MTSEAATGGCGLAARALEVLPAPVVVVDARGVVVLVNGAARQRLGVPGAGRPYGELRLPERLHRREMTSPRLLGLGAPADVHAMRDDDGAIAGAMQVLEDDSLDGAGLCAAMAHEIRNPLTGIQGFARLLQTDMQENDGRSALLNKIISGVQTVDKTVSNMLGFCKSEPLQMTAVPTLELLEGAVELSGCTEGMSVSIDAECCGTVCCDRLRLRQVLINLIRNAAEAMPGGGRLTLCARRGSGAVRLSVSDTGSGMDARARANIFRPFFSTKPGGTGMGLAVAARIVHRHNGDIEVDSTPGAGTTVTLVLPDSSAS